MKKSLIAYCISGLTNRFNCLLAGMEMAKKTNRQLKVFWSYEGDPTFRVRLEDLFDNDFIEVSSQDLKEMDSVELFTFKRSVEAAKRKKGLDDLEVLQKKFGINEKFIDIINSKADNLVFHYLL